MVKVLKWKIPSCSQGHWIPIIRKSKPPSWLSLVFKYISFENLLLGEKKDITKNQCEPIKRRAFLAGLIYNDSQQGLVYFQEIFVNIWTYLWLLRMRESMVLTGPSVQRTEMSFNILQCTGKLLLAWDHLA